MKFIVTLVCVLLFAPAASAQTLVITGVREVEGALEIFIETTIEGPIEIMTGVDLVGQAPGDVYIGVGKRVTIEDGSTVANVPLRRRDGSMLPAGNYDAVASFYPRWGAESAPAETKAIRDVVEAKPVPISVRGSGEAASEIGRRDEKRRWIMLNVVTGMPFNGAALNERLGAAEQMAVTNRNKSILGWYFEEADMTIFQNTLKGEVVTWRDGRQNSL